MGVFAKKQSLVLTNGWSASGGKSSARFARRPASASAGMALGESGGTETSKVLPVAESPTVLVLE